MMAFISPMARLTRSRLLPDTVSGPRAMLMTDIGPAVCRKSRVLPQTSPVSQPKMVFTAGLPKRITPSRSMSRTPSVEFSQTDR